MIDNNVEKLTAIVVDKLKTKKLSGIHVLNEQAVIDNIRNLNEINFEVTERCNLQCKYCGLGELYEKGRHRENRDLKIESVYKLFNYLSPFWEHRPDGSALSLGFYGGEPLMNMRIIKKIITYVLVEFPRYRHNFKMTSNGLLLNKYMDYLVENNVKLSISIDGNRNHNSYRVTREGKESFSTVVKNLDILKEKYPDYFKDRLSFIAVLHDRNDANEIKDFIETKYGKGPYLSFLSRTGVRIDKIEEFNRINRVKPFKRINTYNNDYEFVNSSIGRNIMRILFVLGMCYDNYSALIHSNPDSKFRTGSCTPFQKVFITATGKLLPCEKAEHRFILADLNELENLDFKALADFHNELLYRFANSICKQCSSISFCNACIYSNMRYSREVVGGCSNKTNYSELLRSQNESIKYLEANPENYFKVLDFFR